MITNIVIIASVAAACATITLITVAVRRAWKRRWPCSADFTHHWIYFDELRARRCFDCARWQMLTKPWDTSDGQDHRDYWKTIDYDPRAVGKALRDFQHGRWRCIGVSKGRMCGTTV